MATVRQVLEIVLEAKKAARKKGSPKYTSTTEILHGSIVVSTDLTRPSPLVVMEVHNLKGRRVGKTSIPAENLTEEKLEQWKEWLETTFTEKEDPEGDMRLHIPKIEETQTVVRDYNSYNNGTKSSRD